jgi:hypothetical protein
MSTVVGSTVFAHDTTSVGGQLEHEHIVALSTVVFVFMNAILRFFRDRVFATVEEFRQATSIGAIDYAIFDLMCHGPSEQCGLPSVSAFTCAGCASRKEGVTVYAGVFKNNVLVLLEGNAPSNLGHELTTENTQMREEWSRRHGDIDVYEGATTDDALDSDIFHFACDLGLAPPSVAAAVTAAAPTTVSTTVSTTAPAAVSTTAPTTVSTTAPTTVSTTAPTTVSTTAPTTVSTTAEQRVNELLINTFRTTPTGKFNNAEREALALTLIDMKGVADSSTSQRMFLPAVMNRHEEGQRFIATMTRHLKAHPLREINKYASRKLTKGFQAYFKAFVTNSVPQTNQNTGL